MKLILKKLKKALNNPKLIILVLLNNEKIAALFSDKMYLKIKYRIIMGKKLNLDNPQTFNEKLQWLKLNNRNPQYTKMVDKYEVRKYIEEKIGEEYLIPLLGVWDSPDDIDFDSLPNQFVLKCNHNSGLGMCICRDKSSLDIKKVKKELKKGLKQNYFITSREWPYKNVKPRIIAEKYMVDESGIELKDYKFLCFGAVAKFIELHRGRYSDGHTQDIYDREWKKTDISQGGIMSDITVNKPAKLEELIKLSELLAKDIPHVRVDWYLINDRIYFGEITFFDGSGFEAFDDYSHDSFLGSLIKI